MPEPNEKIEELLKRYIEQRKAESRADFDLHPVTRKFLQGEVTRVFAKDAVETKPRLFGALWPRLALVGAFTAMLLVTVMLLNTPRKSKSTFELSKNSAIETAVAPMSSRTFDKQKLASEISADKSDFAKQEKPAASVAAPSAKRPETAHRIAGASGIEATKQSRAEGKLAKSLDQPAPTETRVDRFFDSAGMVTNPAKSVSRAAGETAGVPLELSSVATTTATRSANAESLNRQRFVQQDLRAKYRQNILSPSQPKILQSFELARSGNKIQFFDADGSVYKGEILSAANDKLVEEDALKKNKQAAEFAFRVVGTNQQLNRLVIFTGEFLRANEIMAFGGKVRAKADDAFQAGEFKRQSGIVGNALIQGKVSIGSTNEFEIQAVEVAK